VRVTVAQLNPIVGDIAGNVATLPPPSHVPGSAIRPGRLPELFVTGYPPRDLLERPAFLRQAAAAVDEIVRLSRSYPHLGILFGAPTPAAARTARDCTTRSPRLPGQPPVSPAQIALPTYDVFDEERYSSRLPR